MRCDGFRTTPAFRSLAGLRRLLFNEVMTEKSLSEMEGYLRPTLQMGRWAFLEVFASSMGILKFGKLATGG